LSSAFVHHALLLDLAFKQLANQPLFSLYEVRSCSHALDYSVDLSSDQVR